MNISLYFNFIIRYNIKIEIFECYHKTSYKICEFRINNNVCRYFKL